jgi:hypothetical protein
MLIEGDWLNMGVKTKVTSFKLAKCDLATAYPDTSVSLLLKVNFFSIARQPLAGQGLLIIEAS